MKVFVTGATGLIGAHTTMELLRAGHSVRLLVRNRNKAEQYFSQRGFHIDDFVVADMRDVAAVKTGLTDCDAVVHAAAVVGVERSQAEEMYRANIEAVSAVVGTACEAGIPNIIYVSSIGALSNDKKAHPNLTSVDETIALGNSAEAYRRSKTDAERYVRELQQRGAPIQITYPTAVLGPDDPGLSESNNALRIFLTQVIPVSDSGFQLVDARDIAIAHRLMLEKGCPAQREQARYLLSGHYYAWPAMANLLDKMRGKKLLRLVLPASAWIALGILCDFIKQFLPFDFPLTRESATLVSYWIPASSEKVQSELGLQFRSGEETVGDTLAWLICAGHVKPLKS